MQVQTISNSMNVSTRVKFCARNNSAAIANSVIKNKETNSLNYLVNSVKMGLTKFTNSKFVNYLKALFAC